MIRRVIEYIIVCDGPDCTESQAYGWRSREEAEREVPKTGEWIRWTRNRWLCRRCAHELLPPEQRNKVFGLEAKP